MKYLATIFVTFILTLVIFKQCSKKEVNQTVITKTKYVIDSLKTITYHDTIDKIKTKYRVITDSIRYDVFDTSWGILRKYVKICDSINEPVSDAELQSVVSRRLVRYCECNDLNSVYQRRRQTDSLIIVNYGLIDANQTGQIAAYEREMAAKNKAIRKRRAVNRVIGLVGIGLILLK